MCSQDGTCLAQACPSGISVLLVHPGHTQRIKTFARDYGTAYRYLYVALAASIYRLGRSEKFIPWPGILEVSFAQSTHHL
jgi:hypothetical protein